MKFLSKLFNKTIGIYKGLPKSVYVLFLGTTINGMGIFVYPFLTLYMTQYLSYSAEKTGFFLMLSSIVYIPGTIIGGKLADTFGRKKLMIISQALTSLTLGVCGFLGFSDWVPRLVLLYLLFDGFADPARSAVQIDITNTENRQAAFSLNYLGHNLGYSIGPILAGFLFYRYPRWLFWGNGIVGFLAVLPMIFWVPETKPSKEKIEATRATNSTEKVFDGGLLKALLSRPKILILATMMSICGFSYAQTIFALPLTTEAIFGQSGAELFGFLMSLNAIVVVIFNAPLVALLRKRNTLLNLVLSSAVFGVSYLFYAWANAKWMFLVLTFGWTIGEIVEATNVHYYFANNTPISHRGRFNSVLPIIQGTGRAIGPYIAGIIISAKGLSTMWIITGVLPIVVAIGILCLYYSEKRANKFNKAESESVKSSVSNESIANLTK